MKALVIGGGISGLVCAYQLHRLGVEVTLLEESARLGGVIATHKQDGFQFELGPQSFLSSPKLLEVISKLGLDGELLRADSKAPRFVLVNGALHPVPMAPRTLLGTSLLGVSTKLKLLCEPLRNSQPPGSDESVAAFVRRKFGADLLDNLVGPFVSGVHAGDPERLSLRSAFPSVHQWEKEYGSVLRGAMKSRPAKDAPRPALCSFRDGAETLVRALAEALGDATVTGVRVTSVRRSKADGSSCFEVRAQRRGGEETLHADALVLATNTAAAAEILAQVSGKFSSLLRPVEYAPVAVVGAGYRREQVGHALNGFGFLVTRKERLRVLGTVWCSSLFPGRAPDGKVTLTSFVGGATDTNLVNLSDDQVAEETDREVARVLRISGPPVTRVFKRWPRALPQYNLGHSQMLAALRQETARVPGLFLTGNYLVGPSIAQCAEQALSTAQAVQQYLSAERTS